MTDHATHELVRRFIRSFQEKQEEEARRLQAFDDRIRKIEERMSETEALVKSFSGRLNGMESRLDDKVSLKPLKDVAEELMQQKTLIERRIALQQLANRSLRDWIYNSDFDHEFELTAALEATL